MAGWGDFAVAALQLAGTAYASKQAGNAAKAAGNQAAAGADKDAALQKYIYDDQRQLAMPGYQRGEWAGNTLAQYLGMGGQQGQPSQDWFDDGQDGAPVADAVRYGNDPKYKDAWDRALKFHYESYGGGYNKDSNRGSIQRYMEQVYGPQQPVDRNAGLYAMFRNQPGYQFGLDEGNKQVQASAAARGGLNSGATLKELQRYGTDYADAKGWQPYLNQLQSMAGLSQTASNQIGGAGQNYANQAGQAFQNAGNARAQSTYGAANARMWGVQQGGQVLNDWYGGYKQRQAGGGG